MSGGVDSSTSAICLLEKGYEVIGCTMRLWEPGDENPDCESSCCGVTAIYDAKRVCDKLGIPHYTLNYKKEFKCKVIDNFIEEYRNAHTPNPCIECNKHLKFGSLYQKAKELECDYIATGHYAKIEFSEKYNQYVLKKSNEEKKDQTYFLYVMPKEELEHIIFPLQDNKSKEETRKKAEENGLIVARKKDSQEICFIPDNNYHTFLKQNMEKQKPGNIILKTGEILGKHTGLANYTIGQRKGLHISYKEPLYVVKLDIINNQVIVGTENDLYSKELTATQLNWLIKQIDPKVPIKCKAKVRYRAKEEEAIVEEKEKGKVKVIFTKPQRAITPGQSVVFYDEEGIVLGGGIIGT